MIINLKKYYFLIELRINYEISKIYLFEKYIYIYNGLNLINFPFIRKKIDLIRFKYNKINKKTICTNFNILILKYYLFFSKYILR